MDDPPSVRPVFARRFSGIVAYLGLRERELALPAFDKVPILSHQAVK